jgi:anti-sigma factor RsiW
MWHRPNCNSDYLSLYVDGELPVSARVELEQHLSCCLGCAREVRSMRGHNRVLAQWGSRRQPLPPSTEAHIKDSLARRRRMSRIVSLSRVMPAAMGSCVAALLVLASANLGILTRPAPALQVPQSAPAPTKLVREQQGDLLRRIRQSQAMLGRQTPPSVPSIRRHRSVLGFY